ncbi:MAG TPA: PIG-L deacetylase family protein [Steroidobacteraceae bacterium]|jgi:LmbE family N-acetylglucosaminyl deacetylase|nr:PIG-L deacetylase family protein [Steroidobacteraceae bacterium]
MTEVSAKPNARSVVIVAAHPDDEVLGCGGTAARLAAEGDAVHILLMADGEGARADRNAGRVEIRERMSARSAAARSAGKILGCASVELLRYADNRMDGEQLLDVVQAVERFMTLHRPSLVLTHHAGDVNVDHRVVHEAVVVACRPQPGLGVRELLFFEVPSSTEWRPPPGPALFHPNWFVDISATLDRKVEALNAYASELREFPHPRSTAAVRALAQWRGASAGLLAAEAFVLGRKLLPAVD